MVAAVYRAVIGMMPRAADAVEIHRGTDRRQETRVQRVDMDSSSSIIVFERPRLAIIRAIRQIETSQHHIHHIDAHKVIDSQRVRGTAGQ